MGSDFIQRERRSTWRGLPGDGIGQGPRRFYLTENPGVSSEGGSTCEAKLGLAREEKRPPAEPDAPPELGRRPGKQTQVVESLQNSLRTASPLIA